MPVYICDQRNDLKYLMNSNGHYSWTEDIRQAVKFASMTTALNFMRCNFVHTVKNIQPADVVIMDGDGQVVPAVQPEQALPPEKPPVEKPPAPKPPEEKRPAESRPEEVQPVPAAQELPALVPGVISDSETAAAKTAELVNRAIELSEMANTLQQLMDFYTEDLSRADMETTDLLHKIEFSKLSVVDGYRLYKQLHEVRVRRRVCKDTVQLLNLFIQSGLWESAVNFRRLAARQQRNIETRAYRPRVLDELFDS